MKKVDMPVNFHHDAVMKRTGTLDPDVEKLLKLEMSRDGITLNEALNRAVRAGLARSPQKPYVLKSRPLGYRSDLLPSKLLELLDEEEACKIKNQ